MSLLAALQREGFLRTVDHALALSLRHAREDTPDLVQAAAALASRALAQGHSQLPLRQVHELFAEIDAEREPPALPPLDEWLALLAASPWVHVPASRAHAADAFREDAPVLAAPAPDRLLVLEDDAIALRRYWDFECRLASALARRARAAPPTLSLVTGGPGTGKTTAVAHTLARFVQARDAAGDDAEGRAGGARLLLAAPTGKAASRLTESVRASLARAVERGEMTPALAARLPTAASTLHRLLGWQRGGGFRHDAGHPLAADLVVVDEASMVDLALMARLVDAVPADATLVLVGDRDQLPSVDTGDVLAALCGAGERATSALHGRVQVLTHNYRQAEDIDVLPLAAQVRAGEAEAVLQGLDAGAYRGVEWRQGSERALHEAVLAQALPAYRALADATDVAAALQAARGFRVLCAVREGPAGVQALNALIGQALDPQRRLDGWFRGRLVLVSENSYRQQLFNGDIGVCWPDEQGELRVWFEGDAGPRAWLPAALPAHEPAFALTVHKSQGSEFDRVLLVLPERGRVLTRELLYTGLTRCRRSLWLWAGEDALREAIGRRAQRWSGLAARV
jgi:exodeoxyribonuclease V alpha subunit